MSLIGKFIKGTRPQNNKMYIGQVLDKIQKNSNTAYLILDTSNEVVIIEAAHIKDVAEEYLEELL